MERTVLIWLSHPAKSDGFFPVESGTAPPGFGIMKAIRLDGCGEICSHVGNSTHRVRQPDKHGTNY